MIISFQLLLSLFSVSFAIKPTKLVFPLKKCVACVTGASRGIGRGIALGLGKAGATVYVTGRSLSSRDSTEAELGGNLVDLVTEIKSLGGDAIAVQGS